jgi:hypothetical protein
LQLLDIKQFLSRQGRLIFHGNFYEVSEKRVWLKRGGFKLRMELTSYKPWMVVKLNHLYQFFIRG